MNQTIKHAHQPIEETLWRQRVQRYLTALGLNGSLRQDVTRETYERFENSPEGAGQNHFVPLALQTVRTAPAERYGSHMKGGANPWSEDLTAWRVRIWLDGNNTNACPPEESPAYARDTDERQPILRAVPDVDRVSMVPERLDQQPPRYWVKRLKRLTAMTVFLSLVLQLAAS